MTFVRPAALLALLALLLSGCIAIPLDPTIPPVEPEPASFVEPTYPEPIEVTQMVVASADPMNFVTGKVCATPLAQCFTYEFTLNNTATVDAELTWMLPVHDFDLYLWGGDELMMTAGDFPPENLESFRVDADAGTYQLVVVAWAVAADTFTLKATFS